MSRRRIFPSFLDAVRSFKEEGFDIHECLDFMQMWYRDVLMYKTAKDVNLLIFKDEFSAVKAAGHSERVRWTGENIECH